MEIELLEDLPSPNTEGKVWKKGAIVDVTKDFALQLIEEGKAKEFTPPIPEATKPSKKGKK